MSDRFERPEVLDADGLPKIGFTRGDVDAMLKAGVLDPEERFEFFEGELFAMSPEGPLHKRFQGLLGAALHQAYRPPMIVACATLDFGHVFFEPDFQVLPIALLDKPIKGSDIALIVEVSISSLQRDLKRKARLYAREGVREYWVVDPHHEVTHVFIEPDGQGWAVSQQVPFNAPLAARFQPEPSFRMADFMPETTT